MANAEPLPEFIGMATMDPDGTIVLNLVATSDTGDKGVGQLRYPMDHPQFMKIMRHLGGITPGATVPVRPFPPEPPEPSEPPKPPKPRRRYY